MSQRPHDHHRRSIRLQGYDYTSPGAYFITICTDQRACLFGEITSGQMSESPIGRIARQEWLRLARRFPNIDLDAFVIMPNHIHGIIVITARRGTAGLSRADGMETDRRWGTAGQSQTTDLETDRRAPTTTTEKFGHPVSGSIPTIIRSYKSSVALRVNCLRATPGAQVWQRNYWEHIIRDEVNWKRIRDYILANPSRWQEDSLTPSR